MLATLSTRIGLTFMVAHVVSTAAFAQPSSPGAKPSSPEGPAPPPAFNTVRTPTSPAFTLLGLSPSSVERPNTPADIAFALLSKATVNGTVPENFAVETSPYWLFSHPSLEIKSEVERSVRESVLRTASVSIGTGQIGTSANPVTGLSFGGRTSLWSGRLTEETEKQLKELQNLLHQESEQILELINDQLQELTKKYRAGTITKDAYLRESKRLLAMTIDSTGFQNSPAAKELKSKIQKFSVNREGFFLEVASAAAYSYPKAVWTSGGFDRWGAWVTPSYQTAKYSLTGVWRFVSKDPENEQGAYDTGGRGTWSADRYAFSLETVVRTFRNSDLKARYRVAGIVEFEVRTGTWLVMSFGRDQNTPSEGSVLAQVGLSFNVSRDRTKIE